MTTIIKNLFNDDVLAVIQSTSTTTEEIDDIISKVKEANPDADYYDIIEALPEDCSSIGNFEEIYF